ncbi:MAG: ABC transporter ATP-binding protein [Candidatus Methanomethylicaceae archaeon]
MVEITLENVTKRINGIPILKNINLEIPDRSLFCILGPPRSGKSMLLRIIAGLEIPDEGKVFFNGIDVTNKGPKERNVSVVFQDFALYPHMNLYKNIASPLTIRKLDKNEIEKKVREISKLLKIEHRLNHFSSQLSGGEKQRAAIARALAKNADLILLDEPLVRLDFKIREDLRAELVKLKKESGKTIVVFTSDPIDALSLGEITAIMNEGSIVQVGNTMDIYKMPRTLFAGKYLGIVEMNTLTGEIYLEKDKKYLRTSLFSIELSKDIDFLGEVIIGIRPEHININELESQKLTSSNLVSLNGIITLTEVIGSDTIVHLNVNNEKIQILVPAIYKKPIGEKISISIDTSNIYLFKKTGELIG